MTLEKVLYTAKVRTTRRWKDTFMKYPLLRLVFVSLLVAQATSGTVSKYSPGPSASRPSNPRSYWKGPVIYRQHTRRSDTFRRGPR